MVFLGFRGSVILVKSSRAKSRDLSCILVYRPMRDSGKGEPFSERSKKEQSARKISRCARNDGRGNGFISRSVHTTNMFGKDYSRIVIPSEAEGSFLQEGIMSYVRQRKTGKLLRKEQERAECKEDFSLRSK